MKKYLPRIDAKLKHARAMDKEGLDKDKQCLDKEIGFINVSQQGFKNINFSQPPDHYK